MNSIEQVERLMSLIALDYSGIYDYEVVDTYEINLLDKKGKMIGTITEHELDQYINSSNQ